MADLKTDRKSDLESDLKSDLKSDQRTASKAVSKNDAWIGKAPARKEGPRKLQGTAKYIDDLHFPNLIHGATVRSTVARGKIKKIEYLPGVPWDEITIVTHKDVPAKNIVTLIIDDQPVLAVDRINHPDEPILLLAHPDRYVVERARTLVSIEYEEEPAVYTIADALAQKHVIWGSDNIFKTYLVEKGSPDTIWANAAHVIDGEYHTGAQEQLYIEPNGMVAAFDAQHGVTIWGSMQCPYYVHKALMPIFGFPAEKVRIIQAETGGGFGGKEEYPSIIAAHAALLAMKSGKAVKILYDRAEDMAATTKRHPSRTKLRTAFDTDGKLLAIDIDFAIDGGAYATLSAVVLSRGTIHAAGPYECANTRIRATAVATNTPPHGAFRGFGAPQSIFAFERHLDVCASQLQMAPEELRRKNFLHQGSLTATSQEIRENIDLEALLDQGLRATNFEAKRAEFQKQNIGKRIKKGIGLATFNHGSGFTGSGEKYLASIIGLEATREGVVRVLAASTEIGQGTNTIFSQIAAQALNLNIDRVDVAQPDTSQVPNSGPTVASRTVMIVGKLVENAAHSLLDTLRTTVGIQDGYSESDFNNACCSYIDRYGPLKIFTQYQQPSSVHWDDQKYRGDVYAAFAWAVYVAEVSVDTSTFEIHVDDFYGLQEVGRVVHPVLAAGQIEGGIAQGIGYALFEKVVYRDGRMINNQMTNYIMPTSLDLPQIRVEFLENPTEHGPGGAKGIGELPMDGPAPAILNAIAHATGSDPRHIPFLPEDLLECLHQ